MSVNRESRMAALDTGKVLRRRWKLRLLRYLIYLIMKTQTSIQLAGQRRLNTHLGLVTFCLCLAGTPLAAQTNEPGRPGTLEGAPLGDPIEELEKAIASGALTIAYDSALGYLPGLLNALDIPVSSQTLIFSRTSLQTQGIAPWAPRAVYFNDDIYIGYVQESTFLEIASVHPSEGAVFYTMPQDSTGGPRFQTETTTCLMCHDSKSTTGGVPGFIMRSVLTDRLGYVITNVHTGPTTDRTPLQERWGGWYVTGTFGDASHAGNSKAPDLAHEVSDSRRYLDQFNPETTANVGDLTASFDPDPYLSPHSDVVALMVLTHQVQVHNFIAMTHASSREALANQAAARLSGLGVMDPDSISPTARVRIEGAVDRLVREMLFSRAEPLTEPISGSSDFTNTWPKSGPRDSKGRSLRDFDLETRLFKYPMSFLIYSDAFHALPDPVRALTFDRFKEVLTGVDQSEDFSHLNAETRQAIYEILLETVPEFATRVVAEQSF